MVNKLLRSGIILKKLIVTHLLRKFSALVEPEGSLPFSQQLINGTYTEPVHSTPHLDIFLQDTRVYTKVSGLAAWSENWCSCIAIL
jgi:hypothetical protein